MRVAYIAFAPFISGAERSLQLMLLSAPAAGIDPVVICPPSSKLIPWCEEKSIEHVVVAIAERDKWHPIRWATSVIRLAYIFYSKRIHVIHSNQVWSFAAASTAAWFLGIPRVCHMRDEVPPHATGWWCKSGVEAVICISRHIERGVVPAWQDAKRRPLIRTIINPVVFTAIDPIDPLARLDISIRTRARKLLQIPVNAIAFGYIGQLIPVKGVLELLDAVAALRHIDGWRLIIAGKDPRPDGDYERQCRQRAEALQIADRVRFLGFLDNVTDFYEGIDVAVVPSLEEPLGRIPLEAATHGKASIAFATGGLVETIEDGVTGWLVPTGDVQSLSDRLSLAIAAPGRVIEAGELAAERVRGRCSPTHYMSQLSALYTELLREHSRGLRLSRVQLGLSSEGGEAPQSKR